MRTSIRIARDSFLGGALGWLAAHFLIARLLGRTAIFPWLEGAIALVFAAGTAAWRVERRIVHPLDAMTRALMQSPPPERLPSVQMGDVEEIHDFQAALERLLLELQEQATRAAGERDRLVKILDAMPVGLLELDSRGRIVFQNRVLKELFGTGDGSIGRTPVEVIRSGELQEMVDAVQGQGSARSVDLTLVEPARRHLTVHAMPLENGLIVITEDMTRIRQLEKARSEMVANIGHELRTPLAAILGYLETLDQSPDLSAESRARFLAVITRNSKRLERLVRDLSRLSRLESSQAQPPLEPLDLAKVAVAVLETLAPRTKTMDIEVELSIPADLPRVLADRDGLETVLLNLLDNAVRATPSGGRITVGAKQVNGQVHLWVEDTGPGIPPNLRERVFERFYRVDVGRSPGEGGTGLGLAIVKHTVLQYGGRVWVEGGPDGGTRVVILLPACQPQIVTKQ